jgi:hypothetical protein
MHAWTAQATVVALRGNHTAADELTVMIERTALPLGAASILALVQFARGLSALGQGRHDEAYDQLRRVYEPGDPAHHHLYMTFDLAGLAEAAAHSGHRDEARSILRLESLARQTPSPFIHATLYVEPKPAVGELVVRRGSAGDRCPSSAQQLERSPEGARDNS